MVDVAKKQIVKLDRELPTIGELSREQKDIYSLLNSQPKESEVKQHPFVKRKNEKNQRVPVDYIPISIIEAKMDSIFGPLNWKVSEPKYQMLGASTVKEGQAYMLCTVLVSVLNTQLGAPVWVERGGTSTGFVEHNTFSTVGAKMKTEAFKNAVVSLGDTFGRNLNRNEVEVISSDIRVESEEEQLRSVTNLQDLELRFKELSKKQQREFSTIYTTKKNELTK